MKPVSGFVVDGDHVEGALVYGGAEGFGEGLAVGGEGVGGDEPPGATFIGDLVGDDDGAVVPHGLRGEDYERALAAGFGEGDFGATDFEGVGVLLLAVFVDGVEGDSEVVAGEGEGGGLGGGRGGGAELALGEVDLPRAVEVGLGGCGGGGRSSLGVCLGVGCAGDG